MTRYSYNTFHCGDLVCEVDGRHIARVNAVDGFIVAVSWLDNGWKSYLHASDLQLVARAKQSTVGTSYHTVVESPKSKLKRWLASR